VRKGTSSLRVNHASASTLLAPCSPAAPQGDDLHRYKTQWPAPDLKRCMQTLTTALIWTQTAEVKWHGEPMPFSKMNRALIFIPSSSSLI